MMYASQARDNEPAASSILPEVAPPNGTALEKAAALLSGASAAEEARFNNLNTRGIALVSAGSLVTALIAVFSKDLLGTTFAAVRDVVAVGILITLTALLIAVATIVVKVLVPSGRLSFGNNRVTNNDPPMSDAADVYEVQWAEYRQVLNRLLTRNAAKAKALRVAYVSYGIAVLAGALSVGVVVIQALRAAG